MFEGPEGSRNADGIAGKPESPERPDDFKLAKGTLKDEHEAHEDVLTDFNADVEQQQSQQQLTTGKTEFGQPTGVTETVNQTEAKGHDPGTTDGEAGLPSPGANDLAAHEQDRECDRRIQRGSGHLGHPDRGDREGDAVGHGESRDCFQQRPAVPDDQQQTENEQQMIDPKQNVLNAQT